MKTGLWTVVIKVILLKIYNRYGEQINSDRKMISINKMQWQKIFNHKKLRVLEHS